MNHPDFRVGGKIFATLSPDGESGMAKLTPEQQEIYLRNEPTSFKPAAGAWGTGGATMIALADADEAAVRSALLDAWKNRAPHPLKINR